MSLSFSEARKDAAVFSEWLQNPSPLTESERELVQRRVDALIELDRIPKDSTIETYLERLRKLCGLIDKSKFSDLLEQVREIFEQTKFETDMAEDERLDMVRILKLKEMTMRDSLNDMHLLQWALNDIEKLAKVM